MLDALTDPQVANQLVAKYYQQKQQRCEISRRYYQTHKDAIAERRRAKRKAPVADPPSSVESV